MKSSNYYTKKQLNLSKFLNMFILIHTVTLVVINAETVLIITENLIAKGTENKLDTLYISNRYIKSPKYYPKLNSVYFIEGDEDYEDESDRLYKFELYSKRIAKIGNKNVSHFSINTNDEMAIVYYEKDTCILSFKNKILKKSLVEHDNIIWLEISENYLIYQVGDENTSDLKYLNLITNKEKSIQGEVIAAYHFLPSSILALKGNEEFIEETFCYDPETGNKTIIISIEKDRLVLFDHQCILSPSGFSFLAFPKILPPEVKKENAFEYYISNYQIAENICIFFKKNLKDKPVKKNCGSFLKLFDMKEQKVLILTVDDDDVKGRIELFNLKNMKKTVLFTCKDVESIKTTRFYFD